MTGLSVTGGSKRRLSGFSSAHQMNFLLSGGSVLELENIKTGYTECELSCGSELFGVINMADAKFYLSGESRVELTGSAVNLSLKSSGASSFNLADFIVNDLQVNIGGGSIATVNASGRMDADLNGSSRLYYIDSPTPGDIDISGNSIINRR